MNVSDELCDDQLGKKLCLESVTGILGMRHVYGLSLFQWSSKFYSPVEIYDQAWQG